MTMFAAFMRNLASNTHLIDVPTLRFAMSFGGLIPTPSDALITPVTFRVRKRGLRGFLRKWDELENGKREIQSEWVVGKRLWQRLQREWKGLQQQQQRGGNTSLPHVGGRSSFRHAHSSHHHHHHHNRVKERVVLFLHGGECSLSLDCSRSPPSSLPLSCALAGSAGLPPVTLSHTMDGDRAKPFISLPVLPAPSAVTCCFFLHFPLLVCSS